VTLTDGSSGDTVQQFTLKGEPGGEVCTIGSGTPLSAAGNGGGGSGRMGGGGSGGGALFSVAVAKRQLTVLSASAPGGGVSGGMTDLTFHDGLGDIQSHVWLGEGLVLVAFRYVRVWAGKVLMYEMPVLLSSSLALDCLFDMSSSVQLPPVSLTHAHHRTGQLVVRRFSPAPDERTDEVGHCTAVTCNVLRAVFVHLHRTYIYDD
jgi:hypothetical protein